MEALGDITDVLGFLVAIVAIGFLLIVLVQAYGLLRVLRTSLRSTASAAQLGSDVHPTQPVAVHGAVHTDGFVSSPVTRTACLAYRLEITARVAGGRVLGGPMRVHAQEGGVGFRLDDGSGPVSVDLGAGRVTAPWAEDVRLSHAPFGAVKKGVPDRLSETFGSYVLDFADLDADVRGWKGIEEMTCTEKVIPPCEQLYVCGTVRDGVLRGDDLRPLIVREETPGQVRRSLLKELSRAIVATVVSGLIAWGLMAL